MHEEQCNEKYEHKIHNVHTWESSFPAKMSQETHEFISFSALLFFFFQLVFIFFKLYLRSLSSPLSHAQLNIFFSQKKRSIPTSLALHFPYSSPLTACRIFPCHLSHAGCFQKRSLFPTHYCWTSIFSINTKHTNTGYIYIYIYIHTSSIQQHVLITR